MRDQVLLKHYANEMDVSVEQLNQTKHVYSVSNKDFMMFTTGSNCVFRGSKALMDWCERKFDNESAEELMDGEHLYAIESKVREEGTSLEGHHLLFEYNMDVELSLPKGYTTKVMVQPEIKEYYEYKEFDHAFSFREKEDCLAIAAFCNDECIAMVACDNRIETSWQIGIDTMETHRGKGLASYLVSEIAKQIIGHNKTPFYTTWGANIASMKVALKAGFVPAASFYYAKKKQKKV